MKDYDKYLQQLLKDVTFTSILYIDEHGKIHRLFCPFSVKAVYDLPFIMKDQVVTVERIAIATNLCDVYIIKGKAYYIFYFIII